MSGQVGALDLVSREMRNLNGWFRKYIREDAGAYEPCRTLATNRVTSAHLARRLEPVA